MAAIRRKKITDLESTWVEISDLERQPLGVVSFQDGAWLFVPAGLRGLTADQLRAIADEIDRRV